MTQVRKKFPKGIRLKSSSDATTIDGEIRNDGTELKANLDSAERTVVTEDQAQDLTNKTIDVDNNTVSNIETDNFKAGVVVTSMSGSSTDTEIPTAKAVNDALAGQNEASEIEYDPTGNTQIVGTDLQATTDETDVLIQTNITDIGTNSTSISDHIGDAVDAHDASAISNVPAGNLAATDQQAVNNELQTDIDTRALDSDLTAHENDAADAHAASAITNTPSGNLAATDQQAVNNELQTDVDTRATSTELTNHEADTSTHGVTTVAGLDETQTLTNKTLTSPAINTPNTDGGTASNTSRLVLPKDTTTNLDALTDTEALLGYDTTLKKPVFNSGTGWEAIGTGSGGGINYVTNPDFEAGTTDWTGDTNLTISQETVAPLRGDGSLKIVKGAIDASGQEVTTPITVDEADLAKKLTVSFDYDFSDANYADGDMRVEITQDPAGTPTTIRVNGEDIKAGKGTHYAQFQTDATELDYELVITQISTGTTAVTALIDNVSVGPTSLANGAIVTDWEEYTPTISTGTRATTNTESAVYRRVGDSLEIIYQYLHSSSVGAAAGSGDYNFSLPAGLSVDTTKLGTGNNKHFGNATVVSGATSYHGFSILSGDTVSMVMQITSTTQDGVGSPFAGFASNNSVRYSFYARVPIEGWSSNAQMSEDLGSREIRVEGRENAGTVLTANTTNIDFTEVTDTTSNWSGTVFTAPETGDYFVEGSIIIDTPATSRISAYVGGVSKQAASDDNSSRTKKITTKIYLIKDEELSFRSNGADTLTSSNAGHYISIVKLASPQTILETETVAAIYTSTNGQSIGATNTLLKYEDKIKDTHNAYDISTGLYTAPTSGFYNIGARYRTAAFTPSANSNQVNVIYYVDNVQIRFNSVRTGTTTNMSFQTEINDLVYLEKGQELDIRGASTTATTMDTNSFANSFVIHRIK